MNNYANMTDAEMDRLYIERKVAINANRAGVYSDVENAIQQAVERERDGVKINFPHTSLHYEIDIWSYNRCKTVVDRCKHDLSLRGYKVSVEEIPAGIFTAHNISMTVIWNDVETPDIARHGEYIYQPHLVPKPAYKEAPKSIFKRILNKVG